MSDTRELMKIEGRPGWRYDPQTGDEFYSAGWLNDGTVGIIPVPKTRHLALVPKEENE